ncbi:hypothetical protein GCM10027451_00830 [Geodermatophilus aquaeductus]
MEASDDRMAVSGIIPVPAAVDRSSERPATHVGAGTAGDLGERLEALLEPCEVGRHLLAGLAAHE